MRHADLPGEYLLAIECDGATCHSAPWGREHDRLRQDVLEHPGWRFYRIWSTDWFTTADAADPLVGDRPVESGATCKADALSLLEIRAALRLVLEDSPGGSEAELIRGAARLMGFKRVGPDLQARIAAGLP